MMTGSRMIRVLKRDGGVEDFRAEKLAAAMWRAMVESDAGRYSDARDLALAVEIFLDRSDRPCVSSAAIFEMIVKVLRRAHLGPVAAAMEAHHAWRGCRRRGMAIRHEDGRLSLWDKTWLCEMALRSWNVGRETARIIVGRIERELLLGDHGTMARAELIDRLNSRMSEFGLADAVPVRMAGLGEVS